MSKKFKLLMDTCKNYVKINKEENRERDKEPFNKLVKVIDNNSKLEQRLDILLNGYTMSKLAKGGESPAALNRGNRPECGGVNGDTEHPMTKCMYYNNKENTSNNKCEKCFLKKTPWVNRSKRYEVFNYQIPMPFKHRICSVGKIDLIVKDKVDNKLFAVEVKPEKGNNESLSRMMAEILTYTTILEYSAQKNGEEYQLLDGKYQLSPAIAFFEKYDGEETKQCEMYNYYNDIHDENFNKLIGKISVFIIKKIDMGNGIQGFEFT